MTPLQSTAGSAPHVDLVSEYQLLISLATPSQVAASATVVKKNSGTRTAEANPLFMSFMVASLPVFFETAAHARTALHLRQLAKMLVFCAI